MDNTHLVIDIGSGYTKFGLSNEDIPSKIIPTIIGLPRSKYADLYNDNNYFVGLDAIALRDQLNLINIIDYGYVRSTEHMDILLDYVCQSEYNAGAYTTLVAIPPFTSKNILFYYLSTMFESYGVPALQIQLQCILSAYSCGLLNGCILEVGEGVTQCMSIMEGQHIAEAIAKKELGGVNVTMYLQYLLSLAGYYVTSTDEFQLVRQIKEDHCYCSLDDASTEINEVTINLPDNTALRDNTTSIIASTELSECVNVLFEPCYNQHDNIGLHNIIAQNIINCPLDYRAKLLENIWITGGSSLIKNFLPYLKQKFCSLIPQNKIQNVTMSLHNEAQNSAWIGGKIITNYFESNPNLWILNSTYYELGEQVLYKYNL